MSEILGIYRQYLCILGALGAGVKTERCEYYNHTLCAMSGQACNETQECEKTEGDKRNHCFVLWNNTSDGTPEVKLKVSN